MTIEISSIVLVNITRETQSVTQAGFGTMMILGVSATFADRIRTYTSIDEVAEDFATTDPEYKAANAAFAKSPRVEQLKIGRMLSRVALIQELVFDIPFESGNVLTLKVDDVLVTVPFNTDHATTMADIEAALEAFDQIGPVVVSGNMLTIEAEDPGIPFSITEVEVTGGTNQPVGTLNTPQENHGVTEDLTEISNVDNDWYALVLTSRTEAEVLMAAAYIETKRKIFVTADDNTDALTTATTDIGSQLKALNYERTSVIWNEDLDNFADAAWLGETLPNDPGSITFAFKSLAGIIADNLSSNEVTNLKDKNTNYYITVGGVDITLDGKMASGEFMDIIRDTDWLQARLEEAIYSRLVNLNKIPYTDAGVAIIENEIRAVLQRAVIATVLSPDPEPTVTVPKVADVPVADRAARLLPDVKFNAQLASAIHKVTVNGVVSI